MGTPALHFLPAFPAGGLPLSEERGVRVDEDRVPVTGTTGSSGLRLLEQARQPTEIQAALLSIHKIGGTRLLHEKGFTCV